jgi:hypothetical protein
MVFDFTTRKITVMGDMERSISPDGRFILYMELDEARSTLMMAENFR